ncbi:hypothetical protein QAD02_018569 [Eretmocerus hayati]|uniref:Uncharacterized protein n=1 Tax=Eretmocerus hayati TaxID=131215 RepID=A0ACC2PHF5_9HYME|nr:hypothetical protein QAD02_018569 [Eretmocerus hayati]
MEAGYDEDVSQNAFFQTLQQEHQPIFDRAIAEGWIICIPRCGSFTKGALTEEDILGHILIPDDELPGTHFHTLTDREVRLCNKTLTIEYDVGKPRTLDLLFEETFYTDDLSKYCVWCIEGLLEQETKASLDDVPTVTSLKECIDLIWSEVYDKNILKELESSVEEFARTHKNLENECLQMQRDLVNMVYAKSLKILMKDTKLRDRTIESRYFLQTIKVATETFVLHGLRKILPRAVSSCTASEDANLNKVIKNLHDLELRDFGIRPDLYEGVSRGKSEMSRLEGYFTVLGKIGCLKRAAKVVSQGESSVSSDELLPVLVYLVVKSGLASWCAQLVFMKQFRFSAGSPFEADEAGFLVTSLEAAVEHVKSGSLVKLAPPTPQHHQPQPSIAKNTNHHNGMTSSDSGSAGAGQYENIPTLADVMTSELFEHASKGNLAELQRIITEKAQEPPASEDTNGTSGSKLCHPLCMCDACERSLGRSRSTSTVESGMCWRDDRGLSCLHVACLHNQLTVVDFLLQRGADPNDTDSDGSTAIHCAAARGHQNALLLLLHSNGNPNAVDSRGNTALHLAADHGHDTCVRAILYFADQTRLMLNVNAQNLQGDTALHFASKWGYRAIVEILMEYGADPNCKNKRGQTVHSLAHNNHIARLLEGQRNGIPNGSSVYGTNHSSSDVSGDHNSTRNGSAISTHNRFGYRATLTDGMHKIDRLFAAVAEGDIRLASYYLGLEGPCSKAYSSERDELKFCHPLCNCEKCVSIEELSYERDTKPPIAINAVNSKGETALHIASAVGCTEIIQLLLDAGAKVNLVTRSEGRAPLHLACANDRVAAAKMLLNCGSCNPDAKDNARDTPLHLASRAANVRIVEMLVRHGANPRIRNLNGATPLDEVEAISSHDIFTNLALTNIAKILKSVAAGGPPPEPRICLEPPK